MIVFMLFFLLYLGQAFFILQHKLTSGSPGSKNWRAKKLMVFSTTRDHTFFTEAKLP
jgi:hypothetical protein